MQISKRLGAAAALVTKNNRVADIGCDHAYTSIYLIEQGIASNVIACDINKGPLLRAKENIERYGYTNQIETRLSDGAQKLQPNEVDTILVSGMGGGLVVKILSDSKEIVQGCKELILQPQSEIFLVREHLHKIGFMIAEENMLIEDGKYYVMMRAIKGDKLSYPSKTGYIYGQYLLETKNQVLKQYLLKEKEAYEKILSKLAVTRTDNSLVREEEVKKELDYIEEGLKYYEM